MRVGHTILYLQPRGWSLGYTVDVLVADEKELEHMKKYGLENQGVKKTLVGTIYAKMFDFHSNMTLYNTKGEMVSSSKKWLITKIGASVTECVWVCAERLLARVCWSVFSIFARVRIHTRARTSWLVCSMYYHCKEKESCDMYCKFIYLQRAFCCCHCLSIPCPRLPPNGETFLSTSTLPKVTLLPAVGVQVCDRGRG